jgi:nickel superoxide dismutase
MIKLFNLLPSFPVYAHCDVPCGIYDPKPAQIAAATCLKMIQKIKDLPPDGTDDEMVSSHNSFVRMVLTKEEHARRCKEELLILWTDYFKPEHLTLFPLLHETFWKASKLCSQVKQTVEESHAQDLVTAVDEIAEIFQKAEAAKAK